MRAPDQKWEGGIRMLQTVGIGKEFQIIRNIALVFFVQPYDGFTNGFPLFTHRALPVGSPSKALLHHLKTRVESMLPD